MEAAALLAEPLRLPAHEHLQRRRLQRCQHDGERCLQSMPRTAVARVHGTSRSVTVIKPVPHPLCASDNWVLGCVIPVVGHNCKRHCLRDTDGTRRLFYAHLELQLPQQSVPAKDSAAHLLHARVDAAHPVSPEELLLSPEDSLTSWHLPSDYPRNDTAVAASSTAAQVYTHSMANEEG